MKKEMKKEMTKMSMEHCHTGMRCPVTGCNSKCFLGAVFAAIGVYALVNGYHMHGQAMWYWTLLWYFAGILLLAAARHWCYKGCCPETECCD